MVLNRIIDMMFSDVISGVARILSSPQLLEWFEAQHQLSQWRLLGCFRDVCLSLEYTPDVPYAFEYDVRTDALSNVFGNSRSLICASKMPKHHPNHRSEGVRFQIRSRKGLCDETRSSRRSAQHPQQHFLSGISSHVGI